MRGKRVFAALVTSAFFIATRSEAATLGTELLANVNAEAGDTRGWVSSGITALSTASWYSDGGVVDSSLGSWIFAGGEGPLSQSLTQTADVSNLAGVIDSVGINVSFLASLESPCSVYGCDSATATVRFLDQGHVSLSSRDLTDPHTGVNVFDFNEVSFEQLVPSGTRSIQVVLNTTRYEGYSSDGDFDNLSLTVKAVPAVPEPSTWTTMSLGLLAFFVSVRKDRRRKAT